ncbi:MAG: alpha/beta hydrolase [Planctomycetota bacterium]
MNAHHPHRDGSSGFRRVEVVSEPRRRQRSPRVLFLGGNGHASVRLDGVRQSWSESQPVVQAIPYPGFEGRPRARSFDEFLTELARSAHRRCDAIYATGIGGTLALALRAEGHLRKRPLILQAPVLWGLEDRRFPRIMRAIPGSAAMLRRLFRVPAIQRRFLGKYFTRPVAPAVATEFFDGYARCDAFADFFEWITPALLRRLEERFAAEPEALADITMWWGEKDKVVGLEELRRTEDALGVEFPLRLFPAWGHYPMMEDPAGWLDALADALA